MFLFLCTFFTVILVEFILRFFLPSVSLKIRRFPSKFLVEPRNGGGVPCSKNKSQFSCLYFKVSLGQVILGNMQPLWVQGRGTHKYKQTTLPTLFLSNFKHKKGWGSALAGHLRESPRHTQFGEGGGTNGKEGILMACLVLNYYK